jgi:phosphohistidine phosphatase
MAESAGVKTLLLLRHAKSSWDDPGLDDHDRPLASRGRKAGELVASYVTRRGISVDRVLCSSAVRARQTFEFVLPVLASPVDIRIGPELYAAGAAELLGLVQEVDERASGVLVVGHNPGLQDLTEWLAGDGEPQACQELRRKFPTAALATLTARGAWSELGPGKAYLESLFTPGALNG